MKECQLLQCEHLAGHRCDLPDCIRSDADLKRAAKGMTEQEQIDALGYVLIEGQSCQ
jgi:hypothetical protein